LPPIRRIPLRLAESLARQGVRSRLIPPIVVLVVYFLIPLFFVIVRF
jgi:hypothetical protein